MRNIKKRLYKGFGFLLIVLLIISGCSSNQSVDNEASKDSSKQQSNGPKVLKVSIPGNAAHLDPHFSSSAPDLTVNQTLYNGLMRLTPGATSVDEVEGDLAESWENNEEGTVWTFHLRKGVQWHNGYGELTSADVKWTFERLIDSKTGSAFTEDLKHIKEIQTPDEYTVVFHLNHPDPSFLHRILIDDSVGAILKKEAIEDAGKEAMVKPVGTGPFKLKEYKLNDRVVLEKNTDYFRGEPKLDGIEFIVMEDQNAIDIAIEKGEIHLATGSGDALWLDKMKNKQTIEVDLVEPPLPWLLHLNQKIKPLDDIRVRQAIAHAIDMSGYVEKVYGPGVATEAKGPIASNLFGYKDMGGYEYNPERSKELLKEAGYPNGLELPMNYVNIRPVYLNMMTFVQEELRKVGITTELKQADIPTYQANIRKGLNNLALHTKSFKPHAVFPMDYYFYGGSIGKANYSSYNKSDSLIEQAKVEMDSNKAEALYAEIQQQIMDEYVVVPLIETRSILVRRAEVDLGYDLKGTYVYSYPLYETTDLK